MTKKALTFIGLIIPAAALAFSLPIDATIQYSGDGHTWTPTGFSQFFFGADISTNGFYRASCFQMPDIAPVGKRFVIITIYSGDSITNINTIDRQSTVLVTAPFGTNTFYRPTISIHL